MIRKPLTTPMLFVCILFFGAVGHLSAQAETIAIIGTGNVGTALGQRFTEIGHTVIYGSRSPMREDVQDLVLLSGPNASATTPQEAAQQANIIVLAVPWDVVEEVVQGLGNLSGRLIIDPTNPREIAEDGLRDFAFHDSNAERIKAQAPEAYVVKAFGSLGDYTMLEPELAGGPVSIPIAGDDANAKSVVAELISNIGFYPVDIGPLRYAHVIEALHYLRYNAGVYNGARINFYLPADEADPTR
ncbi:NADPH-dependent F420 reductase [Gammaproteobacteria bacterium]|jgi:predicted dinucleotide-binding enzyme|nr:NADPH-dependent F420 reductase [Gammaproteobacteria bacterium]